MSGVPSNPSNILIDSLIALRQRSSKGTRFITFLHLQQALTQSVIVDTVDRFCSQEHRKPHVIDVILQGSLRVFAVLVLLRQEELILDFIENLGDQLDNKLPFEQTQISRISSKVSDRFCSEVQWELIPHLFPDGGFHRKIMDDVIIPYTKEVRFDEGSGGEIFECVVAEGQHNFPSKKSNQSVTVIKKRIKMIRKHEESDEEAFKKELQCLELLRCIRHPNIVDLLASYEQHGEYCLLFPKLSMNLADFLKTDNRFGEFEDHLTFFNALSGLASAMEAVHELSIESEEFVVSRIGYHHDIKPKNILVTRNTFVLTDFGLARLKMPDEGSQSQWINTIGDYIAPECMDDDLNRQIVGRSIDIWALGCLVAEVATYMEFGKAGVQDYRDKRRQTTHPQKPKNYRFFEADALRSSVIAWFQSMTDDLRVPGIPCLVEVVALMLQINPKIRPKASEVHRRLQYVSTKMVYRKVVQILDSKNTAYDTGYSEPSPYDRLGCWFEIERVKAWGNVLGMENGRTYHDLFLNEPVIASELSRVLQVYYEELCRCDSNRHDAEDAITSSASKEKSGSRSISAIAKNLASQLWERAPVVYQIRMDQAWRQFSLNTEDAPRLAMIEEASQILPAPYSEIGKNAALKRLCLKFWKEDQENLPGQRGLLIKGRQIEREYKLSETHEVGWLDQYTDPRSEQTRTRVFIEWVLYAPSWETQTEEEKILKTLGLAEVLNQPKPESFRVLDCVGVAPPSEDTNYPGFGYVYNYPSRAREKPNISIKTLADLIRQKVMLEHKFNVAARICSSIYHLHSANWLHKNLRASNIIFFTGSEKTGEPLSAEYLEPYLVGFQHSRPNGEVWHSDHDLYNGGVSEHRHPDYVPGETRFEKVYDYYSIGILLLEIGFWLPIASFRTKHRDLGKHAFRDVVIGRYAPQLGTKMGTSYMNVVIACLRGNFGNGKIGRKPRDILDEFYWTVVAPLTQLRIT